MACCHYFLPKHPSGVEVYTYNISEELKKKFISDSARHNFPSLTAYLKELIERGLPLSKSLEKRLQFIEEKVETNAENLEIENQKTLSLLKEVYKRVYVNSKIVSFILARTFFIKPGKISDNDFDDAKYFIENELALFEKKFEGK